MQRVSLNGAAPRPAEYPAGRAWRNSLILCGGDVAVLAVSLVIGRAVVAVLQSAPLSLRFSLFLLPVWCIGAGLVGLLPAWGLDRVEETRRIQLLLLALFALGGVAYLFGRGMFYPSRLAYLVSWLTGAAGIPLLRAGLKQLLHRAGVWGCPVVLYGGRPLLESVAATLRAQPELGYLPVGAFTDDQPAGSRVAELPVLGGLRDSTAAASVAVAPMPSASGASGASAFDRTLSGYRRVLLLPDMREDVFLWVRPRAMGSLIGMEVAGNLLDPWARALKRGTDLLVALGAAPLWLPLLGLIALAVRVIDGHGPFFAQDRVGRGGRRFRMLKFRTMRADADRLLEQELERDPERRAEWDRGRKLREDPRVTRLGRLLRRGSLDELPQLMHVFSGRMSLVGPRPLPPDHEAELSETVREVRRKVRPGMTGLWQVSGRAESGTEGMERWDSYYVRNWSIWLDLVIVARTWYAVGVGRGAY